MVGRELGGPGAHSSSTGTGWEWGRASPRAQQRHRGPGGVTAQGNGDLEGPHLTPPPPPLSEDPVEPQAEAKFRMEFVPRQAGLRKLMVDFESDKLTGVKGYRNVIIAPLPK